MPAINSKTQVTIQHSNQKDNTISTNTAQYSTMKRQTFKYKIACNNQICETTSQNKKVKETAEMQKLTNTTQNE